MSNPNPDSEPARHDWSSLRSLLSRPAQQPPAVAAARALAESFELFERGVRMMRMNLERAHPDASKSEITLHLRRWLSERAGAPYGDGVGRPAPERLARILGEVD